METPICSICLENHDMLCSGCKAKMEDGDISEEAVTLSRMLENLSANIETLEDVHIKRVIPTEDAVIILTGTGDGPKVVGRNGRVVKKIAEEFDKSIRVVEDTGEPNAVIDKLLAPVEHKGIRTVYKPDGETQKVVVDEASKPRVPFSAEEFEDLVEQLTGEPIQISFE